MTKRQSYYDSVLSEIPSNMTVKDLTPVFYRISHYFSIQARGGDKWVVCDGALVLDKNLLSFEYEPLPSNQTEEFKSSVRFDSIEEALLGFLAWKKKQEAEL